MLEIDLLYFLENPGFDMNQVPTGFIAFMFCLVTFISDH